MKKILRFIIRLVLILVLFLTMGSNMILLCAEGETCLPNALGLGLILLVNWFCTKTKIGQDLVRLYEVAFKLD